MLRGKVHQQIIDVQAIKQTNGNTKVLFSNLERKARVAMPVSLGLSVRVRSEGELPLIVTLSNLS